MLKKEMLGRGVWSLNVIIILVFHISTRLGSSSTWRVQQHLNSPTDWLTSLPCLITWADSCLAHFNEAHNDAMRETPRKIINKWRFHFQRPCTMFLQYFQTKSGISYKTATQSIKDLFYIPVLLTRPREKLSFTYNMLSSPLCFPASRNCVTNLR